ncbi:MAG: hypothetical protein R3E79_29980 [Caldilineaceae bacterium]
MGSGLEGTEAWRRLGKDHPEDIHQFADTTVLHIRPQGTVEETIFFGVIFTLSQRRLHA